jgi:hypothetical protein
MNFRTMAVQVAVQAGYLGSQMRDERGRHSERKKVSVLAWQKTFAPTPIFRPLAHSIACGDERQQLLTPAQTGLTKLLTVSKIINNNGMLY